MKKNVCFLMDSIFSFGGVQRVTAVIAKELTKTCNVTIVTMDKPSSMNMTFYGLNEADIHYRFFSYPDTPRWKGLLCKSYSYLYRKVLPQTQLTSAWYAHSSFPSEKRQALTRKLTEGHYDIIIGVHAPLAVRLSTCKEALNGVTLIGWIHNSYAALFGKGSTYIGEEIRKHYEYQLAMLHHTVVLCDYDARQYHFPTRVIHNPLTLQPGEPSQGTSKKFLAVGRFSFLHKGFDLLIKAFQLFSENNKEWTLDIVGEGPEESMYRQLIADYGLGDRIHIHPFTNNIQQYYSDAQVYVLSSRWEGFGLVLVEAMAHGLPIISSDLPTSREIMGDYGLYFENGNIHQLATRMEEATQLDWPSKSAEAISISQRFNIENIISKWKEIVR